MLKAIKKAKLKASGGRYAIVASEYNDKYVGPMLRAAMAVLKEANAEEIKVVRVPGAFEIPVVAARLAGATPSYSALICLGVILRGATTHAQSISDVVSYALGTLALQHDLPVIHEVLLLENEDQARQRCLSKDHNRGAEAAQTAVAMVSLMKTL